MAGEFKALLDGTKTFLVGQVFSSTFVFQKRWYTDFSKENIGTGNYGYISWIGNTRERESRDLNLYRYRIGVYIVSTLKGLATIPAREARIEELMILRDEVEEALLSKEKGI